MKFDFTPEEAQKTARAVARHLARTGMYVRVEHPFSDDAPYRTTLYAQHGDSILLVETQGTLQYHREIQDLMRWCAANRHHCELFIAISDQTNVQPTVLEDMQNDGVGLMLCSDDGHVRISQKAKNPALVVSPDPRLRYGDCKREALGAVRKFNDVDRKDGLRDMCEIVERETENLGILAVRKGKLRLSERDFRDKDWSSQIDTLASQNACAPGTAPVISPDLKDDLKSFTRGRNLVDHKVRSKREETKRQRQFADRMMQGPRLLADLVALQRRLR